MSWSVGHGAGVAHTVTKGLGDVAWQKEIWKTEQFCCLKAFDTEALNPGLYISKDRRGVIFCLAACGTDGCEIKHWTELLPESMSPLSEKSLNTEGTIFPGS